MKTLRAPEMRLKTVFSLEPLLEFWKNDEAAALLPGGNELATRVLADAARHPEWIRPSCDAAPPDQAWMHSVFSVLFPVASWKTSLVGIAKPLTLEPVYATPGFESLIELKSKLTRHDDLKTSYIFLVRGYRLVLNKIYGLTTGRILSPIFPVTDADGITQYWRMDVDTTWCRVVPKGNFPASTPDFRHRLSDAASDPGRLIELLPPNLFEIEGFMVFRLTDITDLEVVSQLKNLLIEGDPITDGDKYRDIQNHMRTALGKSSVHLWLTAIRDDQVLMLTEGERGSDCIWNSAKKAAIGANSDNPFYEAFLHQKPIALSGEHGLEGTGLQTMLGKDVKSVLILPLTIDGRSMGLASFVSSDPWGLGISDLDSLHDILPLLALGIQRSLDDLDRRVQSFVQERYTSIHPSVAWRFRRAALEAIEAAGQSEWVGDPPPVVFENVWPLYAATDVRNSSIHRSDAILSDLREQIALARQALEVAHKEKSLPILEELLYRLGKQEKVLHDALNTGDEITVMNFLRRELEPVFTDLVTFGPRSAQAIARYQEAIHPEAHALYRKRKDFDESIRQINQTVSAFLEQVQPEAQAMFPHYFDKNSTDGVDQNIYIGPSMTPDRRWDPLYLKNLRLWQLVIVCRIARLCFDLKKTLPVPLDATHLIVVQDLPITIRFRTDEKRFNVDGAYNIRYEIMKKRIDKAVVLGTKERLTQPGQVAVVFSQADEALEYTRYVEFLQAQGWLETDVQEFELEDLQGIHGLRALRVGVKPATASDPEIQAVLEAWAKSA